MVHMKRALVTALVFVLLLLLQLGAAEECTEGMELPAEMSPLQLLQQSSMEWQADSQNVSNNNGYNENVNVEWRHLGPVRVVSPAGEQFVRVVLPPPLAALHCKESRSRIDGFRRGSCNLESADNTEDDLVLHYRVANRVAGGTHTYVGTLCRESTDGSATLVVGTITYTVGDAISHTGSRTSTILHLQFDSTRVAWLPAALRLTGYTHEEVARRKVRQRVASSPLERWGYPLLFVALLYTSLKGLAWWVNRQKRHPHTSDRKSKQA